ncbi:MAG: hypothetical protein IPN83_04515 [Holophagales bacterium]|nr:hypothetical protein [Holophagales bacterium]
MSSRLLNGVLALGLTLSTIPLLAATPGPERYSGFDVAKLAEALARQSTLRTQHGEAGGNAAFAEWLSGEGLSRAGYDAAYSAWWERFKADPTGQLEARFHRIVGEWSQQLNFGDAKDWRQETREGVTLETYAKVSVALTRNPGGKLEDVLKKNGLKDAAHWKRVNESWTKAMKDDTTYALVQQYGALYQKLAGPQFAAEQDAVVANSLSEKRPAPTAAPRPAPETLDQVVGRMKSAQGREKAQAAREYAHACDLWSGPARKDPKDPRAPLCANAVLRRDLQPVLLESLERADDETIGYVAGMTSFLGELELKDASGKLTVQRVLNRAEERLATLEASFAPIKDKAVPERMPLRTKISEYQGVVRDLKRTLETW